MSKFLKYLSGLTLFSFLPLPLSCVAALKIPKSTYIIEKNSPNTNLTQFHPISGIFAQRSTLNDSLTGNYLLRYAYVGESKYDYLNKYFQKDGISAKFLKFGIIDGIKIIDSNGTEHIFDTDSSNEFQNPHDFVKPDINRGYKKYIYQIYSKNKKSINSRHFFNVLKDAKSIEFSIPQNKPWFDNEGKQTGLLISGFDVLNSLINANLSKQQLRELELVGFNNVLNKNNFEQNRVFFALNSTKNFQLLLEQIVSNKIFSAYSQHGYFGGAYAMRVNDFKHTEYISLTNADIKRVLVKYNPVGKVDRNTHRLHILNEYEQGLITSEYLSLFNSSQQQNLLDKFKSQNSAVKLNIIQTPNIKTQTLMFKDRIELNKTRNLYEQLMYGFDETKIDWLNFYSGFGFKFRNLITQVLNKYSLNFSAKKTHYYDNFINPEAKISNANNTNYQRVIDAIDHVNKNVIYTDKMTKYYSESTKEHYYLTTSFLDSLKQIKSPYYSEIKLSLNRLLDKFYTENLIKNTEKIVFVLPLELEFLNSSLADVISLAMNELDSRLIVKLVDVSSELAKKYYNKHEFVSKNTMEYLNNLFLTKDNNLIRALEFLDSKNTPNLTKIKQHFENFFGNLNTDKILTGVNYPAKINEFIFQIHQKLTYWEIINLINEIKILYSVPYNLSASVDLESFKYELVQPWIIKPTRDDNLVYYEDIKIKEE
ncbi:lipoprotein [Mycoplasmopsis californica]|uniref:Lipoprotein n=1 Tax=Mycoplasmopsis californica TaxID=2113 RepID=A0A059XWD2_9BACT|nr:hypothetical protein [Mycoplasmopsis californica]AIA29542.1 lipoprotein [Mycoplasmopsis californica]